MAELQKSFETENASCITSRSEGVASKKGTPFGAGQIQRLISQTAASLAKGHREDTNNNHGSNRKCKSCESLT